MTPVDTNTSSQEEILSIQWLNLRQRYDASARSRNLVECALSGINPVSQPVIADLGCGSGGNSLQLMEHLRGDLSLVLIDQHNVLLDQAKQQFVERYGLTIDADNRGVINLEQATVKLEFVHCNIFHWMEQNHTVHLFACGALLDLLTQSEAILLVNSVVQRRAALLASLNYTGTELHPACAEDQLVVAFFEQHMVRKLDRGCPLGPACVDLIRNLATDQSTVCLMLESSNWRVLPDDTEFLGMNIEFYLNGAKSTAKTESELSLCQQWSETRKTQIANGLLELSVFHQDILLRKALN